MSTVPASQQTTSVGPTPLNLFSAPLQTTDQGENNSTLPTTTTTTYSRSSMNSDTVPGGAPIKRGTRKDRVSKDEDPAGSLLYQASWKMGKILQHFAVRSPHILVAMGTTYLVTHYYFNNPTEAIENAAFVGLASAAYCFVRPFFLETIPSSMLGVGHKTWRELINISYTVFTTLTLSSCVWDLKVPAVKGLIIWALSFGPSLFLSNKLYPAIDADFKPENRDDRRV